jgi:ketosteroid isomerase-like protein
MKWLCAIFLLIGGELRPMWDSLVQAERSFARASIDKGTKEAFLSVLAEDSIVFRPRAVQGRAWFVQTPANATVLNWEAEFADISSAGDLGYTTGPWEYLRAAQDQPVAFGHYVTLWRKQSNAEWRVVLDIGIGHEYFGKPAKVDSPSLPKDSMPSKSKQEIETSRSALAAADRAATVSLTTHLANDVRLYREGTLPILGKTAALKHLAESPKPAATTQIDALISNSADLGYTYGGSENANYLRIWKKERNGWKIVLDLLSAAQ